MDQVLIDASYYVSLALDTDKNHSRALKLSSSVTESKVTTEDFLKEALTVISQRKGKSYCISFYNSLSDTKVIPASSEFFHAGLGIFLKPNLNKNVSLIDCIGSVVYKELNAKAILTFDPHFKFLGLTPLP